MDEASISTRLLDIVMRMPVWVIGAIRIVFVILNNLYCIPVHLVWLVLLQPLRLISPRLYWKIEGIFFRWLLSMVAMWSYSAGYDIIELGDDVWQLAGDRTLVMYNHQSTSDVPLIMAAFNCRPNFTASVMWIMDRVFRMTNFGVVSLMHGDFFIRAGAAYRDSSLHSLRQHLANFYQPRNRKWIVLFPEGGFLVNRKPTSQKFGQKHGLPHLQHVSLPRCGALKAILEHSARQETDDIKWVVDVTVGYPGGEPLNLQTLIAGWRPACATVMHYRCYSADQIPLAETDLNAWLYERYVEKERLLAEYYATGVFPDTPSPAYPAPLPLPPLTYVPPMQNKKDDKQQENAMGAQLQQCNTSSSSEALLSARKTSDETALDSTTTHLKSDVGHKIDDTTTCGSVTPLQTCDSQSVVVQGQNGGGETSCGHLKGCRQATCTTGCVNVQTNPTTSGVHLTKDTPSCECNASADLQARLCGGANPLSSVSVPSGYSSGSDRIASTSSLSVSDLNLANAVDRSPSSECTSSQSCNQQQQQPERNTCYGSILRNGDDRCVPDTVNNNSPKHSLSQQKSPLSTAIDDTKSFVRQNLDESSNCNRRNGSTTSCTSSLRDSSTAATTCSSIGAAQDQVSPLYPETHRPYLSKLPGVALKQDPLEFMLRHIFYLVSSYLALSALSYACSSLLHRCC